MESQQIGLGVCVTVERVLFWAKRVILALPCVSAGVILSVACVQHSPYGQPALYVTRTLSPLYLPHNGLNYGPIPGPDPALPNRTFSDEDFSDGVQMI